jgi:predicted N-acyltransferase
MGSGSDNLLEVSILRDPQDFVALEEEWQDLYHNSPLTTPFQSWEWLYSWWEAYGVGYDLYLITMRREDLLAGILPLMVEHRRGPKRLLFVGSGQSIYLDALMREGWEEQVTQASIRALRQMGLWKLADLQQLRPQAAAWSIFRNWSGFKARVWQDGSLVLDVRPWEEMLAALNQKQRSNTRRAIRRAEKDGVRWVFAEAEEAEQAASRLLAWHREAWKDRDINPEHLTPRFEALMRTAARRMTAGGVAAVSEFRRGEEAIAAHLLILGRDFVGGYLGGATDEALRKYSIQPLYIWDGINVAGDNGLSDFDLMWGAAPHKTQWQPRVMSSHRVILGRNPILTAPYAGYHLLHSRARRYVNSESAPPRVREAADRYRKLRARLNR